MLLFFLFSQCLNVQCVSPEWVVGGARKRLEARNWRERRHHGRPGWPVDHLAIKTRLSIISSGKTSPFPCTCTAWSLDGQWPLVVSRPPCIYMWIQTVHLPKWEYNVFRLLRRHRQCGAVWVACWPEDTTLQYVRTQTMLLDDYIVSSLTTVEISLSMS